MKRFRINNMRLLKTVSVRLPASAPQISRVNSAASVGRFAAKNGDAACPVRLAEHIQHANNSGLLPEHLPGRRQALLS